MGNPRHFRRIGGELACEDVPLSRLAEIYGTPLFVYSKAAVLEVINGYRGAFKAFDPVIAYAMKANANPAIIRLIAEAGGGADIVSGGELEFAIRAGVPPERIVFAGVGKSESEMRLALERRILIFNVESVAELKVLSRVAASLGVRAPIAIRVNPDVDPRTHAYISTGKKESKFGLDVKAAMEAFRFAVEDPHLDPIGVHSHIGSQITLSNPFVQAAEKISRLIGEFRGIGADIRWVDLGGGLGITYKDETPPTPGELSAAIGHFVEITKCRLILEPGRSMVGNAGALVTRIHYIKPTPINRYVIVDAAMNDLARPALYDAYHPIELVADPSGRQETKCDVVGPICETGDFLAKGRILPLAESGELLSIGSAGAYGMAMSSNYNIRPRAAEVLVDGSKFRLIRRRETIDDLFVTVREVEDDWKS